MALYEYLREDLEDYMSNSGKYPYTYVIGMNKKGVIDTIAPVLPTNGCSSMPGLTQRKLNIAVCIVYKANRIPYGLCRVGSFPFLDGGGLSELSTFNEDAIMLQYSPDGLTAVSQEQKYYSIISHKVCVDKRCKGKEVI